jgi:hypothetical protein
VAHPMDKIDINSIEHAGEFFHQLKYIGRGVGYFLVIFCVKICWMLLNKETPCKHVEKSPCTEKFVAFA